MDTFDAVMNSGLRLMVPLLLAALGELISERAGVMNIGLEGYMTAGAFTAIAVVVGGWNIAAAIALAAVFGAIVAAAMALGAVWLRGNGILVGFAIFVMVPGLANFLFVQQGSQAGTPALPTISVPVLGDLPLVGPVFDQNIFYWMAVVACIITYLFFARTKAGLIVVAVGHDPEAVRKRGYSPRRIQTWALLACGCLAGLGGASLTLGAIGSYQPDVINGRGLIAIAIVILGRWTVTGAIAGSFLIALLDALKLRVSQDSELPVQLLGAVPWIVVIVMLLASTRLRSHAPRLLT